MPPKKKEMSPESRAKADHRNERLALKRGDKGVSGGGPKKRKLDTGPEASTTEEEIPVSGTGSGSSAPVDMHKRSPMYQSSKLLIDNQFLSAKLRMAEEAARFYERSLDLREGYVAFLEWREKVLEKRLEKQSQEWQDLNTKEWNEAHDEKDKAVAKEHNLIDHYLDLLHMCQGKLMVHDEDVKINHTALLAEYGCRCKVYNFFCHSRSLPLYTAAAQLEGHPKDFRTPECAALPSDGHHEGARGRSAGPLGSFCLTGGPSRASSPRPQLPRPQLPPGATPLCVCASTQRI
jgi:hypothetical protein